MKKNIIFKMVRIVIVLLFTGFMHLNAVSYSQTITLKAKGLPLAEILETIREQTGYAVYVNVTHLEESSPVSIQANNIPLQTFLEMILEDQPLNATVKDKTIVLSLKPTKETSLPNTSNTQTNGTINPQIQVAGRVVSSDNGQPVPNVTVRVKGTTNATATDADGNYRLEQIAADAILVFSSVGYRNAEVTVNNRTVINISLEILSQIVEEVVVAYGTQRRESITGSVASISSEDLERRVITNPTQALAGSAPGIQATTGNGQPGSAAGIRIRGYGSINASNAPLYVLDGFPYGGSLADISANDIENISVLKDASATALYGARAANGVIIITTKKGVSADPRLNINVTTGQSSRAIPEYEMVDVYDYYPVFWTALKNNRIYQVGDSEEAAIAYANNNVGSQLMYNPFNVPSSQLVTNDGRLNPNASLLYNDFDWIGAMSQNGARNDAQIDYSAKLGKSDYYVSLGHTKDNGFIIGSDFERVNGRISLNSTPKTWLTTGINLAAALVDNNNAAADSDQSTITANPFVFSRGIGPIYPVRAYTATGEPILDSQGTHIFDYGMHDGATGRPAYNGRHVVYESLLNTRTSSRNSLIGRTYAEVSFLKYFKFTANAAIDLRMTRSTTFQSKEIGDGATNGGTSSRSANEYRHISYNQLLNYERDFGPHRITILAGHESTDVRETYLSASRRQENLEGNIELVNFTLLASGTGYVANLRREAYLSRVSYGYNDKIFVDASLRRDASSRFSPQSRWGTFYSAGAAWVLSNESPIQAISWINNLRLRAAYGTVGNDALGSYYEYQGLYSLGATYNNALEPGALASKISNPDLTWEVNQSFNAGLDFAIFNNRIDGSIEVFSRGSSQLLFDVPKGLSAAINERTENIGTMHNTGLEVLLHAELIKKNNFRWDIQSNHSFVRNKISHLPDGNPIISGTKRLEEGRDIYAFYLRQWYGADPINGQGLWLRDPEYDHTEAGAQTINGEEVTNNPNHALYDYSGSAIPKYYGSLNNTFSYKGVSLSFLLNYQLGGKIYDSIYGILSGLGYGSGVHKDMLQAWTSPGETNQIPRLDVGNYGTYNSQSTRFLVDATHLNLRNISVAYHIPSRVVENIGMQKIRVFAIGENLHTWTKRKGLNPVETFNGTNSRIYVPNRYISVGLNVTL